MATYTLDSLLNTYADQDMAVRIEALATQIRSNSSNSNERLFSEAYESSMYLNLTDADLRGAKLSGLNMSRTCLGHADLRGADLRGTDLSYANLICADLRGANISFAKFDYALLDGAKIDYQIESGLLEKIAHIFLGSVSNIDILEIKLCLLRLNVKIESSIQFMACALAKNGKNMLYNHGINTAGLLLLGEEAHKHFHDDEDQLIEYLKLVLDK